MKIPLDARFNYFFLLLKMFWSLHYAIKMEKYLFTLINLKITNISYKKILISLKTSIIFFE